MKVKKQKLKFKPTPISRLRHYKEPIKMVGDPPWYDWKSRCERVYQHEIERKSWPMAWKPETWQQAQTDNERIDRLLRDLHCNFDSLYSRAMEDQFFYALEEAERENAVWDYHHENYLVEA